MLTRMVHASKRGALPHIHHLYILLVSSSQPRWIGAPSKATFAAQILKVSLMNIHLNHAGRIAASRRRYRFVAHAAH